MANPENGPRTDAGTGKTLIDKTLISGPIGPALLLFALPMLGWSMLKSANGLMNAVWIGRLPGQDALLAATTNGNPVMFLLAAFVFGMSATILLGQSMPRAANAEAAPAGSAQAPQIGHGLQP